MISSKLWSLLFIFCLWTTKTLQDENVALNKQVYGNGQQNLIRLVNGQSYGSISMTADEWVVIDLGQKYRVNALQALGSTASDTPGDLTLIKVRVLKTLDPCNAEQSITQEKECAIFQKMDKKDNRVTCRATGQFVVWQIVSKSGLEISELEVFGTSVPEKSKQPLDKPTIRSPKPVKKLNIRNAIVGQIRKVSMLRSGNVLALGENSEPVLTHPKSDITALVGSIVGNGRMLTCGRHKILDDIKDGTNDLWKQASNWLSQGATPRFYDAASVTSKDCDKPGAVILWNGESQVDESQAEKILKLLRRGNAGLAFCLSPWRYSGEVEAGTFYPVLEKAGVTFGNGEVRWDENTWQFNPNSLMHTLSIYNQLTYILYSHSNFESGATETLRIINELPNKYYKLLDATKSVEKLYSRYIDYAREYAPCKRKPITDSGLRLFMDAIGSVLLSQALAFSGHKAPNVASFPGDVPANAQNTTLEINFNAETEKEQHSTGLYLPAGRTLVIETLDEESKTNAKNWKIQIGCHQDNIYNRTSWPRFPVIAVEVDITQGHVYSPFGGLVWIKNIKPGSIKLRLNGAVRAPFFNVRDRSNRDAWANNRHAPGPWADIAGDAVIMSVPSKLVRNLSSDYLYDLMFNYWDRVIKGDHHLRGSDWVTSRRQRLVVDVEISKGSMHSGYPVMGHLNKAEEVMQRNMTHVSRGIHWGPFHEFGHNMQKKSWTFEGTKEVTCNIFALFNREQFGFPIYISDTNREDILGPVENTKVYFENGAKFDGWTSDNTIALKIYQQLAYHLGWGLYKKAFRRYYNDKLEIKDNNEKIEMWIIILSQESNYNLAPLFAFWGFPISSKAKEEVKNLTPFLPDDRYTQLAPDHVKSVLENFKGVVRKANKVLDPYASEMKTFDKMLKNDVNII